MTRFTSHSGWHAKVTLAGISQPRNRIVMGKVVMFLQMTQINHGKYWWHWKSLGIGKFTYTSVKSHLTAQISLLLAPSRTLPGTDWAVHITFYFLADLFVVENIFLLLKPPEKRESGLRVSVMWESDPRLDKTVFNITQYSCLSSAGNVDSLCEDTQYIFREKWD